MMARMIGNMLLTLCEDRRGPDPETCRVLWAGMKPIEVYELYADDTPEARSPLRAT